MVIDVLRIEGGLDAPGDARAAFLRFGRELRPDELQVATLLTSELVSNAVRHAHAPELVLGVRVSDERIHVEVYDGGHDFHGEFEEPDLGAVGGYGLFLVNELASRWGVHDAGGTRVWFEIDR